MKHLIQQAIYEYVNLDKSTQEYIAMQIVEEWLSWGYKEVSQSKFLFIKHLFPHLVNHSVMYRGIDVNYLNVPIERVKEHVWRTDNGKYVSWCKDMKHTHYITKNMSRKTRSNYITIITQKSMGISILDVVSELSELDIVNHPEWSLGTTKALLDTDKISEVLAPLSKSFEVVGVYDIYKSTMYNPSEWKAYLPEVLNKGISIYKWKKERDAN